MREDMAKVVYERPKSNRTWVSKTPRGKAVAIEADGLPFDEAPFHRKRKREKHTRFREEAIVRFLNSRVGQPWDKVYSEFCANADARTEQGSRMRDSLGSLVGFPQCWGVPRFSIHPKTGLLTRLAPR